MGSGTELIFVEGHSTDDTWATIQRALRAYDGPLKLRAFQQTGKGKGDAVRLGFAHASGDLLMILDADLTVPPEDLPTFYDVLAGGHADFVQGTRLVYPMEPGAMRFFNKLGNVAFSQLFTYLLQQPIKDTLCGTKVLWRKDYERIAAARVVLRRLRSVRRLRSDLRRRAPQPQDRRDSRALPRPHLRRDQHPALEARPAAAAHVRGRRAQAQVRVAVSALRTEAQRGARSSDSRITGGPGTATARCARSTPTGTGASRPSCRRRRWARASRSARGRGSRAQFIPDLELTDLVRAPWHDREASADALPFADASLGALVLFDVLHHLPAPARFFAEAVRVLRPGGRIVMCEPYISPLSYPVYKFFTTSRWTCAPIRSPRSVADGARDPFDSNQAIPTLLFGRARGAFEAAFPALAIRGVELLAGLSYPASGGFSRGALLPWPAWSLLHRLESRLPGPVARLLAFRMLIVLERAQPADAGA